MTYKGLKFLCEREFKQTKCVILGNGESLLTFKPHDDIFTIGVNDACKFYSPNVLLLIDSLVRFERRGIPNRIEDIRNGNPDYYVIHDAKWELPLENTFQFPFGKYKLLPNLESKNIIDIGLDSPYVAMQLAYKMGFKKIAIIGVDYTPNHFYSRDGDHELVKFNKENELNRMYGTLHNVLKEKRIETYNLSPTSKITSIPHITLNEFIKLSN